MRLTEKDYCGYDIKNRNNFNGYDNEEDSQKLFSCLQKLGQLEDIEDELGIDLLIFLKIFTQENIYIRCNGEIFVNDVEFAINCDKKGYFINLEICQFDRLYLKDYGKTWALTREELL